MDVLHDRYHRHGGLQGFGESRDQQRRGWSVLRGNHRDLVRDPGIGVRHRCPRVLGPIADLPDAVLRRGEKQGRWDALPEINLDPVSLQRLREEVCAGGVSRRRRLLDGQIKPLQSLRASMSVAGAVPQCVASENVFINAFMKRFWECASAQPPQRCFLLRDAAAGFDAGPLVPRTTRWVPKMMSRGGS